MKIHHTLDIYRQHYEALVSEKKKCEIRKERPERPFIEGQVINLEEIGQYGDHSGRVATVRITHISRIDIADVYKFAILSVELISAGETR